MHKFKIWIAVFALVMAILMLSGCSGQNSSQQNVQATNNDLKELHIGIVPLPHYAHMWVAKKKGFIDEELQKVGFKLKWEPFGLGTMVNEGFMAGKLDMGVMGDFPAFIGRSAGTNYQIVSIASTGPKTLALVAKKDSDIVKVADLKGKKVGTTKGSYGQQLLTMLLENNGLSMNDIQFMHVTMDDLTTALVRGDVDAGVIWEPLLTRMEEAGEIKIISDGVDLYEAYAVLMASGDMIEKNPQAINAVLKAFQRGNEYLKQNPDECFKLLMEDIKIPQLQLDKIVNKFDYNGAITDKFVADMKNTEVFMRKNELIKKQVDVDAFIRKQ